MNDETKQENVQPVVNPLLARAKLPGETVSLPSGGLFYTKGVEIDEAVKNSEVHVYPMAAYDEIIIKTPALLLNGDAVEKIFHRCIPEIKSPMDLLAKDVDFLLIALRKVTYGAEMDVTYTHTCKDAKPHDYRIDISDFISKAKKINPTTVGRSYKKTLGNGQVVELRPARYREMVETLQTFTLNPMVNKPGEMSEEMMLARAEEETKSVLASVKSVIRSVDGISDAGMIDEWLHILKADWITELTESVEKTSNWGPSFVHKTKCKDCGKLASINVPINPISFFT